MNRYLTCVMLAMLWPMIGLRAEPPVEQAQPMTLQLGDEVLIGRIIYGDTTKFWKEHTLLIGTVAESRQEYLPMGKLVCLEHVEIRIDETIPTGRFGDQPLWQVTREQPVIARDVPSEPPPQLYRAGTRLMLLVTADKEDGQVDFDLKSYAMMPNGHRETLFLEGVDEGLLASTRQLCQALATDNPFARVEKLGEFLKQRRSPREKHVVLHNLEVTIKELKNGLEEAERVQRILNSEG